MNVKGLLARRHFPLMPALSLGFFGAWFMALFITLFGALVLPSPIYANNYDYERVVSDRTRQQYVQAYMAAAPQTNANSTPPSSPATTTPLYPYLHTVPQNAPQRPLLAPPVTAPPQVVPQPPILRPAPPPMPHDQAEPPHLNFPTLHQPQTDAPRPAPPPMPSPSPSGTAPQR